MSPASDRPVVIIGGGPVGMTAALLLARFDVPSVILEAKPARDPFGSKALCMQRDVLDVLDRVGCGQPLVDEGVTWTMGRTYYRGHELFQITFPDLGRAHFPPFVNVGQDRTEHHLERAVGAEGHIDLRYGHEVVELTQDADRVVVGYEGPAGRGLQEADYVIGADGAGSATRRLLGIGFDGRSFDDQFLICDIRTELPFADERRFFFDPEWNPDRQVLIHPQADSVWRIDWQVPPDFDVEVERTTGRLDERIRKITGDRPYEIVWMSVYRFHQRLADRFAAGRVFLAGDAAHLMSPFGARGLNSGIQDAENIAWKIGYVRNRWAAARLLRSYEPERRPAAEENLRITGKTMDFLVPPTEELWAARRTALEAAVGNPQAPHLVDSGQLAQPFVYADSPLTSPGGIAARVVPGQLFPDGPVVVRDAPTRMRALFGRSIVVLATGGGEGAATAARRIAAPVDVHVLEEIDREGVVAAALPDDEPAAAVIRPDGHLAALVAPGPARIVDAVATTLGAGL